MQAEHGQRLYSAVDTRHQTEALGRSTGDVLEGKGARVLAVGGKQVIEH
jgi:hypothetical protein